MFTLDVTRPGGGEKGNFYGSDCHCCSTTAVGCRVPLSLKVTFPLTDRWLGYMNTRIQSIDAGRKLQVIYKNSSRFLYAHLRVCVCVCLCKCAQRERFRVTTAIRYTSSLLNGNSRSKIPPWREAKNQCICGCVCIEACAHWSYASLSFSGFNRNHLWYTQSTHHICCVVLGAHPRWLLLHASRCPPAVDLSPLLLSHWRTFLKLKTI